MKRKIPLFNVIVLLLLVIHAQSVYAQQTRLIKGKIIDAENQYAIPGATISTKNGTSKTSSNSEGLFEINVPVNAEVQVSSLNYETYTFTANESNITIALIKQINNLEDVVVIGYGSVKRKDVTTAISSVSTKDLEKRPIVNVGQAG